MRSWALFNEEPLTYGRLEKLIAQMTPEQKEREVMMQVLPWVQNSKVIPQNALLGLKNILYELRQGSAKKPVIKVFRDGDNMCALFGENLQEGEAEFEPILSGVQYPLGDNMFNAASKALNRLTARLGFNNYDYTVEICE